MTKRGNGRKAAPLTVIRKEKGKPCEDFWHTLSLGLPIAVALFVILPPAFRFLSWIF